MKAIGYIKEWFGRDQNWVWVLLFAAIVLTPFAAAHAQLATSYDAGTILDNAVTYFQGNFGTGLASVFLLSVSLRTLPMGTGYAIWTGIGAAGTVIVGVAVLGESAAPLRILWIALILAGVIGLKFGSGNSG